MFLQLFSKLHGIYITFFQQTLEPWWETTSRVLLPVGLPGGTKNTPVGHAGAEAQSNYFFEKTTAFYQNRIGVQLVQQKVKIRGENVNQMDLDGE